MTGSAQSKPLPFPFALSLSKGASAALACFDKLSTNGFVVEYKWLSSSSSRSVIEGAGWADYGLVDSGNGRKFERYGRIASSARAAGHVEPAPRRLGCADGEFVPGSDEDGGGRWQFARTVPARGLAAWRGTTSASPRRPPRSATSGSSPTWRRCGTGCCGQTRAASPKRRPSTCSATPASARSR